MVFGEVKTKPIHFFPCIAKKTRNNDGLLEADKADTNCNGNTLCCIFLLEFLLYLLFKIWLQRNFILWQFIV